MKLQHKILAALGSFILILALYVNLIMLHPDNADSLRANKNRKDILNTGQIQEVIADGISWFKENQEDNGHFRYEYMPYLDRHVDDDNIVRQAGGIYVLGEILAHDTDNKFNLRPNIQKAIHLMEGNSPEASYNDYNFRCVAEGNRCQLGTTGLVLIAALDLVEVHPEIGVDYIDLIEDYKDYIIAMKKPDEGFRNLFITDRLSTDEQSTLETAFANGEAWLALTRYYQYNPNEEVKEVIDSAFQYFQEVYTGEGMDNNFHLWGMAALKDLHAMDPQPAYVNFSKPYTDWRIENASSQRSVSRNRCAYIEGITSAYSILEQDLSSDERKKYLEEINFWLAQAAELQTDADDTIRIHYPDGQEKVLGLKDPNKAIGGFLTDLNEPVQRIDFTQHCLNSYLQKLVDIDGKTL